MGRARRTPKRKLPVIKRVRQSRPAKQVSVRLASSVQTRPAIKKLPLLRRKKIKPPTFGRAKAGARGRRPIRVKPKGRLVTVRKRPFRREKILRVASRGLGTRAPSFLATDFLTRRSATQVGVNGRSLAVTRIRPTRVTRKRVGARGRTPIREGRRFLSIQSRVIGKRPPARPRRVTQVAQFVPFQQRTRPTRGQKRLRSTPSKQRAVRESFGAFAGAIQETPQFRIGRAIAEELPPVRVAKKLSKVKFKADKPFPFAKFGSDFDVLNLQ